LAARPAGRTHRAARSPTQHHARPRELVPVCRTRTVHATSSAPSYESAHRALAARPAGRTRHSPPAPSTTPVPRTRTCEPNSYGARYELGTQVRVGAPGGARGPTRPAHGASAGGAHRPHPALATPRSPAGARPTRPA